MIQLTQKHVDTLIRAQTCHLMSYNPSSNAMYRNQFDDDILRIEEMKNLIMRMVYDKEFQYGSAG